MLRSWPSGRVAQRLAPLNSFRLAHSRFGKSGKRRTLASAKSHALRNQERRVSSGSLKPVAVEIVSRLRPLELEIVKVYLALCPGSVQGHSSQKGVVSGSPDDEVVEQQLGGC